MDVLGILIISSGWDGSLGIRANDLDMLLWPEVPQQLVKDNRDKTIQDLRSLLDRLGGMSVTFEDDTWHLEIDDRKRCDYFFLCDLVQKMDVDGVNTAIDLMNRGPLLCGIEKQWADIAREQYMDLVFEIADAVQQFPAAASDDGIMLRLCCAILTQDSINESAIRTMCLIYCRLGHRNWAKQLYHDYRIEHYRVQGVISEARFSSFLRGK